MKKIYALIAATGLVLSASAASAVDTQGAGSVMSNDTVFDSVEVSAKVNEYAAITFLAQTDQTDASGAENSFMKGAATFSVESNCDVDITITNNDLAKSGEPIDTMWSLDTEILEATFNATADLTSVLQEYEAGVVAHTAYFGAKLGAISAQAAGTYSADLKVTVAAAN